MIVAEYTGILEGLTPRMRALEGPLDEAYRSAPKFEAGVGRAHGFGTRALEEFKDLKVWLKVNSNGNHDLNLAANGYMAERPYFGQARRKDGRAVGAAPA
ncbi:hypothetical protein ACH4TY_26160 [Streptomyces anulatus]